MSKIPPPDSDLTAKIVVVGPPSSGKFEIVSEWARQFSKEAPHRERVGETSVDRAVLTWRNVPRPDATLTFNVYTTSGEVAHSAISHALLDGADGLVFVVPVDPSRSAEIRASLEDLEAAMKVLGRSLTQLPVVLHYHRSEGVPDFDPDDLDRFLGIEPGTVPRVVTSSEDRFRLNQALVPILKTLLRPPKRITMA